MRHIQPVLANIQFLRSEIIFSLQATILGSAGENAVHFPLQKPRFFCRGEGQEAVFIERQNGAQFLTDLTGVRDRMIAQPLITVEIDYERLGETIAKHLAPLACTPANLIEAYWSTKEIGHALGIKSRKTVYDVVNKSGFPEARYFTKERRWKSTEVLMWAERQKLQLGEAKTEKPKAS